MWPTWTPSTFHLLLCRDIQWEQALRSIHPNAQWPNRILPQLLSGLEVEGKRATNDLKQKATAPSDLHQNLLQHYHSNRLVSKKKTLQIHGWWCSRAHLILRLWLQSKRSNLFRDIQTSFSWIRAYIQWRAKAQIQQSDMNQSQGSLSKTTCIEEIYYICLCVSIQVLHHFGSSLVKYQRTNIEYITLHVEAFCDLQDFSGSSLSTRSQLHCCSRKMQLLKNPEMSSCHEEISAAVNKDTTSMSSIWTCVLLAVQ